MSAVIAEGKPRELLNKGIEGRYRIVTSDFILNELASVLRLPRFETGEDEIQRAVLALIQSSEVVKVESDFTVVRGDPADYMILMTGYDGHADVIVTGDKLLLKLGNFEKTRILSVSAALREL